MVYESFVCSYILNETTAISSDKVSTIIVAIIIVTFNTWGVDEVQRFEL